MPGAPRPDTRHRAPKLAPRRLQRLRAAPRPTAAFRRSRAQALASSSPLAHLCTRAHTCERCSVPPGPITLSCRARSTAQRHRDIQHALCTSTSTHTGRLATLHHWLILQRHPLPTTGGGLTKVPAGQAKTCAKNAPGGEVAHRAARRSPARAATRLCFGRATDLTGGDLWCAARHEERISADRGGACVPRTRRRSATCRRGGAQHRARHTATSNARVRLLSVRAPAPVHAPSPVRTAGAARPARNSCVSVRGARGRGCGARTRGGGGTAGASRAYTHAACRSPCILAGWVTSPSGISLPLCSPIRGLARTQSTRL